MQLTSQVFFFFLRKSSPVKFACIIAGMRPFVSRICELKPIFRLMGSAHSRIIQINGLSSLKNNVAVGLYPGNSMQWNSGKKT